MAGSVDLAQQLGLEDELALLVLLRLLVGLVVLPADDAQTLLALDVAHQVSPRRHVALAGLALLDVDDRVEEVGLAVLAAEVLLALATDVGPFREDGKEAERWKAGHGTYSADDVVMVGEMRLALAATVDTVRVEVDVVGETHDGEFVDAKRGEGGRWHGRIGSEDGGAWERRC
jgi:hypothetical protein